MTTAYNSSSDISPLDAQIIGASSRVHAPAGSAHHDDDDSSSVFSYDLKQETNSTLPNDPNFEPIEAHLPVHVQRRLSQTNNKDAALAAMISGPGVARVPEDASISSQQAIAKRRDSVLAGASESGPGSEPKRRPSRKPTGSFGIDESLKPLSTDDGSSSSGLFFSGGLGNTTSSASN